MDKKAHLKSWLDAWIVGGTHPGAVMGVYDKEGNELFYHDVDQSKFNPDEPKKYNRDSIFRIYSMTKPITSVAAMILVDRKLLSIDDPLSKYIPAFANTQVYVSGGVEDIVTEPVKTPLTIKHIMTHTSGITYALFGTTPCDMILRNNVGPDAANWYRNTELSVLCDAVARSPLCFQPGTKFLYGLNTDILGHVVEIVSGMKLNDFFMKEIFQPLGMIDTDFYVPPEKIHRLVDCYSHFAANHSFKLTPLTEIRRDVMPTLLAGGGGLNSTLADYARFCRCLINGGVLEGVRILSAEAVAVMTSNHLPGGVDISDIASDGFSESVGPGYGFGLGVAVLTKPLAAKGALYSSKGEYGWGGVASTVFAIDPEQGCFCILLTQVMPSSAYPLRAQMRYMVHWMLREEEEGK